jgi:hypothetical protein
MICNAIALLHTQYPSFSKDCTASLADFENVKGSYAPKQTGKLHGCCNG